MTAIKICGIDSVATAELVVSLGVEAMGVMLVPASVRYRTLPEAMAIARVRRQQTRLVVVFADADADFVAEACDQLEPDLLQFHGAETAAFCRQFERPYLRAFRADGLAVAAIARDYQDAAGWLIDAAHGGQFGGTGGTIDWSRFPEPGSGPWILAGGLDPDNVEAAIGATGACAVDVSSGVETARRGEKSAARIEAFCAAVRG